MAGELLIVIQYWKDDEASALNLARLMADIEPSKRETDCLVLARRKDCVASPELFRTRDYCSAKFTTMVVQSNRPEVDYPAGCHGLWSGTLDSLYNLWSGGMLPWPLSAALMTEADAMPIHPKWIDRIKVAHEKTRLLGKHVTGAMMDRPTPHVNGNSVIDLLFYADHPALKICPPEVAWDIHAAPILIPACRVSNAIRNEYGTREWSFASLAGLAHLDAALLHGCKDSSVEEYTRHMLKHVWKEP
jgi:hypothetical protein